MQAKSQQWCPAFHDKSEALLVNFYHYVALVLKGEFGFGFKLGLGLAFGLANTMTLNIALRLPFVFSAQLPHVVNHVLEVR